jgi:hypothetical protein
MAVRTNAKVCPVKVVTDKNATDSSARIAMHKVTFYVM